MKISKILIPMVALTATNNYVYKNNQVIANCEEVCHGVFHRCIDLCTVNSIMPPACYVGCGIAWTTCMGICAAMR